MSAVILSKMKETAAEFLGEEVTVADFSVGNHSALALHADTPLPLDEFPATR